MAVAKGAESYGTINNLLSARRNLVTFDATTG